MDASTAKLLVTNYGKPLGLAHVVNGKKNLYAREYERATVKLDCSTFTATFDEHTKKKKKKKKKRGVGE